MTLFTITIVKKSRVKALAIGNAYLTSHLNVYSRYWYSIKEGNHGTYLPPLLGNLRTLQGGSKRSSIPTFCSPPLLPPPLELVQQIYFMLRPGPASKEK